MAEDNDSKPSSPKPETRPGLDEQQVSIHSQQPTAANPSTPPPPKPRR